MGTHWFDKPEVCGFEILAFLVIEFEFSNLDESDWVRLNLCLLSCIHASLINYETRQTDSEFEVYEFENLTF